MSGVVLIPTYEELSISWLVFLLNSLQKMPSQQRSYVSIPLHNSQILQPNRIYNVQVIN